MLGKTVQKGYLVDIDPFCSGLIRRVLVDDTHVFIPTHGWVSRSYIEENYKIHLFLKKVDTPSDWDWDGWWEKNWSDPSWSWCYMFKMPRFTATYVVDGCVFAA